MEALQQFGSRYSKKSHCVLIVAGYSRKMNNEKTDDV